MIDRVIERLRGTPRWIPPVLLIVELFLIFLLIFCVVSRSGAFWFGLGAFGGMSYQVTRQLLT